MSDSLISRSRKNSSSVPPTIPDASLNANTDSEVISADSIDKSDHDNLGGSNSNSNNNNGSFNEGDNEAAKETGPSSYLAKISNMRHKTTTPLLNRSQSNPLAHLTSAHAQTPPTSSTLKPKTLVNPVSNVLANNEIESFYEPLHRTSSIDTTATITTPNTPNFNTNINTHTPTIMNPLVVAPKPHTNPMIVETETVSVIPTLAVGGPVAPTTTSSILSPGITSTSTHNPLIVVTPNASILPSHLDSVLSSTSLHSAISAVPSTTDYNSTPGQTKKKRLMKKGTNVHQSIIGKNSKAEIFAAKVASAVGDHHSSDSEETFVYESNANINPIERINSNTSISTSQNRSYANNNILNVPSEDSFGGVSESNDDYEGPYVVTQSQNQYGPLLGNLGQGNGQLMTHLRHDSSDTDANSITGYEVGAGIGGVGANALFSSIGDGYQTLVGPRRSATRFARNGTSNNITNGGNINGTKTAESVFAIPHPVNKTQSTQTTSTSTGMMDNNSIYDTTSGYTDNNTGLMSSSDDNSSTISRQRRHQLDQLDQQQQQQQQQQYVNRYTKYRLNSTGSKDNGGSKRVGSSTAENRQKRYLRHSSRNNTDDDTDSNNVSPTKSSTSVNGLNNTNNVNGAKRGLGSPRRGYFRDIRVSNRGGNNNDLNGASDGSSGTGGVIVGNEYGSVPGRRPPSRNSPNINNNNRSNPANRGNSATNRNNGRKGYILTDDIDDDDFDLDDDLDDEEELVGYSETNHSRNSKIRGVGGGGGVSGLENMYSGRDRGNGNNDVISDNNSRLNSTPTYELAGNNNNNNKANNNNNDYNAAYDSKPVEGSYGSMLYSNRNNHSKPSLNNNGNGIRRVRKSGMLYSPHNYQRGRSIKSRYYHWRVACYIFMVMVVLSVGFVFGFFIASNKSLDNVRVVSIDDILVSDDELVFNIEVQARNPGFLPLVISNVDIDIFAKSAHVKRDKDIYSEKYIMNNDDNDGNDSGTILLGNVVELDMPLVFQGSLMHRNRVHTSTGVIKLVIPEPDHGKHQNQTIPLLMGQQRQGEQRQGEQRQHTVDLVRSSAHDAPNEGENWRKLNSHPFNMIVRGVIKYDIPIVGSHKVAYISKTVYVDPNNI